MRRRLSHQLHILWGAVPNSVRVMGPQSACSSCSLTPDPRVATEKEGKNSGKLQAGKGGKGNKDMGQHREACRPPRSL